ncbi:hypothetical protein D3C86_1991280 [compost metagenome]
MGLQNGLTASISNSVVKTTHSTGLTTDLAILISMFTKESNRHNKALVDKFNLLLSIVMAYVAGGLLSGLSFAFLTNKTFYVVCFVLLIIGSYDYYKLYIIKKQYVQRHRQSLVS